MNKLTFFCSVTLLAVITGGCASAGVSRGRVTSVSLASNAQVSPSPTKEVDRDPLAVLYVGSGLQPYLIMNVGDETKVVSLPLGSCLSSDGTTIAFSPSESAPDLSAIPGLRVIAEPSGASCIADPMVPDQVVSYRFDSAAHSLNVYDPINPASTSEFILPAGTTDAALRDVFGSSMSFQLFGNSGTSSLAVIDRQDRSVNVLDTGPIAKLRGGFENVVSNDSDMGLVAGYEHDPYNGSDSFAALQIYEVDSHGDIIATVPLPTAFESEVALQLDDGKMRIVYDTPVDTSTVEYSDRYMPISSAVGNDTIYTLAEGQQHIQIDNTTLTGRVDDLPFSLAEAGGSIDHVTWIEKPAT